MNSSEPSMRRRELGRRLLSAQRRAGLTGADLAAMMQWDQSRLSRTMSGQRPTTQIEAAILLARCGIGGGAERDDVLRLCDPRQDASLTLPLAEHWPVYLAYAKEADRLLEFQHTVVPWFLQTPDYTRALITEGPMSAQADDEAWFRARRAATELPRLTVVDVLLHEWSLRTTLGGNAVMSAQLHHLLQMSVWAKVTIRVVPIGCAASAARHGAFTLLESAGHATTLYREEFACGVLTNDATDVASYEPLAHALLAAALTAAQTRELISRIAVDLYSHDRLGSCPVIA